MPHEIVNTRATRLLGIWLDAVVRARIVVVLLLLLLTGVAFWFSLTHLEIDTDTTDMISPEVAFRQNGRAFDLAFPQLNDTLVVVIDGASSESVDAAAKSLVSTLQPSPLFHQAYRPDASPFLRQNGLLFLELDELVDLADRMAQAEPLLGALAAEPSLPGLFEALQLALRHVGDSEIDSALLGRVIDDIVAVTSAATEGRPGQLSWRGLLLSKIGPENTARGFVIAQPKLDHTTLSPAANAIAEIRKKATALGIGPDNGLNLRLTGSVALEHEELQSAEIGGKAAAGVSLILVTLLLGVGLRSVRLVVATVVTLLVGLIWTAAFAALAIGHLNLISVAFAVLFVGLAVDFSIHFCLRYREELATPGASGSAVRRAGLGVGRPLAISAVAAGIGFYAFLPTDYRGFAELGLISGTSMFIALFANLTLLPALLALLHVRAAHALPRRDLWHLAEWLVSRHYRPVLLVTAVVLIVALLLAPSVRFDFNPINLKDPTSESFTTFQDLARAPDSTVYAADVLAADLDTAKRIAAALSALASVDYAITLASFVPTGQAEKLEVIDEMALFLAPLLQPVEPRQSDPSSLAQSLSNFLGELETLQRAGSVPPELASHLVRLRDVLQQIAPNSKSPDIVLVDLEKRLLGYLPQMLDDLRSALSAGKVVVGDVPEALRRHWVGVKGRFRVQAVPAGNLDDDVRMRGFVNEVLAVAPQATGTPIIVSKASDIVVASFSLATALAIGAIAILLFVLYRNLAFVALTLLPLLLAAALTLATSVVLDLAFNFANVIVLPLLFGLGVSSSIHLVERQRRLPVAAQLMRTTTPRAVLFSTLTTLASFGSLAISAHRGMSSMGQLLTVAIVFTLICTLVVLPSLMPLLSRWLGTGKTRAGSTDVE